ncbi:hypothetical protein GC174_15215 [bacterium]|nr:hypothetical protein [bacterium]
MKTSTFDSADQLGVLGLALQEALQRAEKEGSTLKRPVRQKMPKKAKQLEVLQASETESESGIESVPESQSSCDSSKITVGCVYTGRVEKKLEYGLLVRLPDEKRSVAFLSMKELRGGTHQNRKERHQAIETGVSVEVEVTKYRPADLDNDRNKASRVEVSEKVIQEREILDKLVIGSSSDAGTVIRGTVREVRDDYALIDIAEGPALGMIALLHASQFPGDSRQERDQKLASLSVGDAVEAEVYRIRNRKKGDLEIALSFSMMERRAKMDEILSLAKGPGKPGSMVTCSVSNKEDYGVFVMIEDGPARGLVGLIHVTEMPGRNRDSRDAYLADLAVGQSLNASVVKAEVEGRGRVKIGLSLREAE